MTATIAGVTTRDLDEMPLKEGWRYEIIAGELYVSTQPSWQHQYICGRFIVALAEWNDRSPLGLVIPAPGVIFADDDNVAPDVVWISTERLTAIAGSGGHLYGAPELVVEVLSPGRMNQMRDREAKLDLYRRRNVLEYWLADPEARIVEVHRREGGDLNLIARLREGDRLASPLLPGFNTPVAPLFPPHLDTR